MVTLWLFEVGYGPTYLMVKMESDRIPQIGEKIDTYDNDGTMVPFVVEEVKSAIDFKECKWCERVDVMMRRIGDGSF
jgi:hypothetical protein